MTRNHYNGTAVIPFSWRHLEAGFQSIVCNPKKSWWWCYPTPSEGWWTKKSSAAWSSDL